MNAVTDLQNFVASCWNDIFTLIRDAAVYIDHASAECLHWYTGDKAYASLKDAGAISVHELAMYNFRYVKVIGTKKAVIISTSTSSAFYQRTIRMITEKNAFESCTIVCGADPNVINYPIALSTEDITDYAKMKRDVKNWINSANSLQECFVDIIFQPIFLAIVTDNVFVTPPFGNLMPPVDNILTDDLIIDLDHLVNLLDSLFAYLNVKEDIYTIGNVSEYVAEKLELLPAAIARKTNFNGMPKNGVSLILVDRTVDLCTATSYNNESVLGKILCTLSRLPHHCNDVAVNVSPLLHGGREVLHPTDVAGCLATNDKNLINMLISKKQKEVLLTANKLLTDTSLFKESPKAKIATRISAHSLEKLVHKIHETNNLDVVTSSSKEFQIILAIIQALKSNKTVQLELLISLEKLILQNLAASRDSSSILVQISNVIKTRTVRGLDTENLLALLIYIYALAGSEIQFSHLQEQQLHEAITNAILEDIKVLNEKSSNNKMTVYQQTLLLLGITDDNLAKESANKITAHIMKKLHIIAEQRRTLHDYVSLMNSPSSQEMVQCIGIVEQLITDILHPEKPTLRDLRQRPSSLISAGYNLFLKGRTKHHPTDNSWIILYVIGGITPEESRRVQEVVSSLNTNFCVTLAGSRLLNPVDIVDKILLASIDT